ncbi:MAG: ABC transporter permease [Meiothermus sp.]|nr:ABC transporter permease [Meiothermus sp.]
MTAFLSYLARRLLAALGVLFGVSILIFVLARVIPGDPARIALGPMASQEQVENLREELYLDRPLPLQYVEFVRRLAQGDLGMSLYTRREVTTDLAEFFPATLELVLAGGLIMVLLGLPLGILAAYYRNRWPDNLARVLSLLGVVTPSFVWAIFLILLLAYWVILFPVAGRLGDAFVPPPRVTGMVTVDALLAGQWATFRDAVHHMVLPAFALAMAGLGQAARLTRANMLDTYGKPYIEMARAYGIRESTIAFKYALRPAMIPTLTILGLDLAAMLGGAFLVEAVFNWPGMARYAVQAILRKDLNAIVGTTLIIAAFFLLINILVDLIVGYINPRIRFRREAR